MKLLYFREIDGDGEYVVLSTESNAVAEFLEDGYGLHGTYDVEGIATYELPCEPSVGGSIANAS